jgi:hypothetical protein
MSDSERRPLLHAHVLPPAEHVPPIGGVDGLKQTIQENHKELYTVIEQNEWGWAYDLLHQYGEEFPEGLQNSLLVADIAASVVDEMGEFTPAQSAEIVLAAAIHDVGKGAEGDQVIGGKFRTKEQVIEGVYKTKERWRENPEAWQWEVVERHTTNGQRLINDASSGSNPQVGEMALLHHSFKRVRPHPVINGELARASNTFVDRGAQVIASVDVAEALSNVVIKKGGAPKDRSYLDRAEFQGGVIGLMKREITVDERVVNLALKHTARVKGIPMSAMAA